MFEAVSRVAAVAAFGLFGLAFVLAPQIVQLAFGPAWSASVPVMKVLCLAGVFLNLVHLNRILLGAVGRADREFYTYLAQAVLCSIGFYFAGQIGIIAFAWVLAGVLAALVPVCVFLSGGSGAVSAAGYFSNIAIPAAGAVAAVALAGWAIGAVPPHLATQIAAGTLAFGAVYGLVAGFALRGQLAVLKSLVQQRVMNGTLAATSKNPHPATIS
jgi:O-antigen/teichoic acid export membrane protein